ncbi:TRAP transporter large permease subunit, partial [Naasia sp. SYSU D00057]|uniref:TRAP transporter large permease subunit n=1 Tax=Naasia sp. SYSU D00057 TaxID=2817380 RepID=UPI0027DD6BD1
MEYPVYLQCVVLFAGTGWTLRQGGHIRVAVLLQALPPGIARLIDMAGCVFAIGFLGFACSALWQQLIRTVEFGSTSYYPMGTPLWLRRRRVTAPITLVLGMLLVTLAGGIWVGVSLMSIGIVALEVFRDMRVDRFLAGDIWSSSTSVELITLPLFILMGELLVHTRLSENLFRGLSPWTRLLPGRLVHVNVMGCALFAAVSG